LDLEGKVPIVAFDKDPDTLGLIEKGAIASTIAQKPYVMSYYGLKFLDDLHHNAVREFKDWRTAPAAPCQPGWIPARRSLTRAIWRHFARRCLPSQALVSEKRRSDRFEW